ncbi:unnamed protein product [Linum tenue]|uniref:Uncharacterized protein n=1 Tax=Linum tenue TaxID=586396 RepID=A0AAV0S4J8_9ROSI|nr:unnamed protein product [Linum tenue]
MEDRVAPRILRGIGVAVASQVGGHGAVTEGSHGGHLAPPAVPELRESVEEEDHGAVGGAGLRHVDVYAVQALVAVAYSVHVRPGFRF